MYVHPEYIFRLYIVSEQVHPLCLLWVHPSRVAALSEKNKWERPKTEARQTQIHKIKHAKTTSNNHVAENTKKGLELNKARP